MELVTGPDCLFPTWPAPRRWPSAGPPFRSQTLTAFFFGGDRGRTSFLANRACSLPFLRDVLGGGCRGVVVAVFPGYEPPNHLFFFPAGRHSFSPWSWTPPLLSMKTSRVVPPFSRPPPAPSGSGESAALPPGQEDVRRACLFVLAGSFSRRPLRPLFLPAVQAGEFSCRQPPICRSACGPSPQGAPLKPSHPSRNPLFPLV